MTAMEIERPAAKIAALERRAEWLSQRIRERSPTDKSRTFDQAELAAIEAGIAAIRCVTGMKREAFISAFGAAVQEPEKNPVLALDELNGAVTSWLEGPENDEDAEARLMDAQARAGRILAVYED